MNGVYWHSEAYKPSSYHKDKFLQTEEKGIQLLQITDLSWNDPSKRPIWESIIRTKVGRNRCIFARKTEVTEIPVREATEFLDLNHIQGSCVIRWSYGLKHNGTLVGVMAFCMHEKSCLNLTRIAFLQGITVVGGAQKLFRFALNHLPSLDIISFSSNEYSTGAIYLILGFQKDVDLAPSHQWFFRGALYNKRHFRRIKLPIWLGDDFDPTLSERDNMLQAGAHCVYDTGYKRWLFRKIK